MKSPGAAGKLRDLVKRSWWRGERPAKLEPAASWMHQMLQRNEDLVRSQNGRLPRMLALVTGTFTPERWVPSDAPGYQGNLLEIPIEDPNYRAKRNLASVLRHVDPRLRRRALVMIDAARDVMKSYAKSGWGWTTYYSEAYTFIFKPVEVQRGHRPTRGGGKPLPKPTTPRGGGPGGGGSTGGGPATGGGR